MPDAAAIAADPAWVPHAYDAARRKVQFLRIAPDIIESPLFLADYRPPSAAAEAWLDGADVARLRVDAPTPHFIFHTAFCRSTLLVRALNASRQATGLNEPGILNSLAVMDPKLRTVAANAILKPCTALLARPRRVGETVVIKPSNVANALIPAMMAVQPQSRAVLMSNSLQAFCGSVHRKGLMGRRWVRRLTALVRTYAPLDLGLDHAGFFELTDMQVAGLAWFLQQRWFAILLDGPAGERMLTLQSDTFAQRPAETLLRVAAHFGLDMAPAEGQEIAGGPLFSTHAKLGGSYSDTVRAEHDAAHSSVVEEEIAMVSTWIERIAQQAGVALPVVG